MKKVKLTKYTHSSSNEGIVNYLELCENLGIHVRFKLADRLEERGLTVRKCSELTGLRLGTISDLMNGKKSSATFQHVWVLMTVLGITNINDILELYMPQEVKDVLNKNTTMWIKTQEVPETAENSMKIIQGEIKIDSQVTEDVKKTFNLE